jgi:hypothetical protein
MTIAALGRMLAAKLSATKLAQPNAVRIFIYQLRSLPMPQKRILAPHASLGCDLHQVTGRTRCA